MRNEWIPGSGSEHCLELGLIPIDICLYPFVEDGVKWGDKGNVTGANAWLGILSLGQSGSPTQLKSLANVVCLVMRLHFTSRCLNSLWSVVLCFWSWMTPSCQPCLLACLLNLEFIELPCWQITKCYVAYFRIKLSSVTDLRLSPPHSHDVTAS